MDTESVAITDRLWVGPLVDPTIELLGHDWRSDYARRFWTPIVGPSALLVGCWVADQLDIVPGGFVVDLADLAPAIGLGHGPGRHSPLRRTLRRVADFDLATLTVGRDPAELQVLRRVPELPQRRLRRLPVGLQRAHEQRPAADPDCVAARQARERPDLVRHLCTNRDGAPLRPGQSCWVQARSEIRVLAAAKATVDQLQEARSA